MIIGKDFIIYDPAEQYRMSGEQKVKTSEKVNILSDVDKSRKDVKKIGIVLGVASLAIFFLLAVSWSTAPDIIAYGLMGSFITGIVLLVAYEPLGRILLRLRKNWTKKYWLAVLATVLLCLIAVGAYVYKYSYVPQRNLKNGYVIVKTFDCPSDHSIKAHLGSMIYHTRFDPYYDRTNAANGYCFDTVSHAKQQGFRAPYNL